MSNKVVYLEDAKVKNFNVCEQELPLTFFHLRKEKGKTRTTHYGHCRECRKKLDNDRLSKPYEYLKALYRGVRDRQKKEKEETIYRRRGKRLMESMNMHKECRVSFNEFLYRFLDQYKAIGMMCPLTGKKMTTIRGEKWVPTNMTVDRIDNDVMYTYHNIMFISNEANQQKGAISLLSIISLSFWLKHLVKHKYKGYEAMFDNLLDSAMENADNRKRITKHLTEEDFKNCKNWSEFYDIGKKDDEGRID